MLPNIYNLVNKANNQLIEIKAILKLNFIITSLLIGKDLELSEKQKVLSQNINNSAENFKTRLAFCLENLDDNKTIEKLSNLNLKINNFINKVITFYFGITEKTADLTLEINSQNIVCIDNKTNQIILNGFDGDDELKSKVITIIQNLEKTYSLYSASNPPIKENSTNPENRCSLAAPPLRR